MILLGGSFFNFEGMYHIKCAFWPIYLSDFQFGVGPRNESDYSCPEPQSNVLCHLVLMTQNIYDAWNLYGNQRLLWGLRQASIREPQCRALRFRSRALPPSFRSGSLLTVGPERSEHLAMTRYEVMWPDLPFHCEWGAVWHSNSQV
jgi:hypothetical protein